MSDENPFAAKSGTTVSPAAPASEVDVTELTVDAALDWVGEDKRRARSALKAEQKQETPRTTLVEALEKILG